MMKTNKNIFILSVICLLALVATPVVGNAAVGTAHAEDSQNPDIYFIRPTSIALVGNYLFVADNVDDNNARGVLWSFALDSYGAPTDGKQLNNGDNGRIVGLSGSNLTLSDDSATIGSLYVIYESNKAVLYDVKTVDGKATLTQNANAKTVITPDAGENLADATVVQFRGKTTVAYATQSKLTYLDPMYDFAVSDQNIFKNAVSLFYGNNVTYVVKSDNTVGTLDMTNTQNSMLVIDGADPKVNNGFVFTDNDGASSIALYNNSQIIFLQQNGAKYLPYGNADSWDDITKLTDTENATIVDIATSDGRLYVLDSNHQVVLYNKSAATAAATPATDKDSNKIFIGSDTVSQAVPDVKQITSYTLAKSVGYPTNIVYKTTDGATSIVGGVKELTADDTFIVLGYDGSSACPYYLVLVGDRFGWVMKSDGATAPEDDDKITVLSSRVNETVDMKAKLTSPGDVYVYDLPYDGERATKTKYTQSAQNLTEVRLLQTFRQTVSTDAQGDATTVDLVWYLVSFEQPDGTETKGFVKQSDIGYFSVDPKSTIGLEVHKANLKINATLFEAVTVYATADLTKGAELYNAKGNIVKLYSGDRVFLLSKSGNGLAAEICILHNDNTADYGWIDASRLIDANQITANTIAGLSFLGGACLLAILLLVVFKVKKKKSV
nr:MAG TPA: hypothetical protein [Caudoviricetes sp.]